MKSSKKPVSPFLTSSDQPVSFAELFFDLVFVYAITQVVQFMHGGFYWIYVLRAVLVFWLVWWGWTQYTWALNAANTLHRTIQIAILVATAFAFFMAVSVPLAFDESSIWFALAYVAVRSIGLYIYLWVTWPDKEMRRAVRTFATLSVLGLCSAIAGGLIGGEWQYALWLLTIFLDMLAASIGGNSDGWNLHPRHFSERHGLFVIIALGEILIIAANAATEEISDTYLLIVSSLCIAMTCSLWWIYFFRLKEKLQHVMRLKTGAEQSKFGRDVYSLLHFPLICGLIIYAYAIEEAMTHPHVEMSDAARAALAVGILVYSIGIILAHLRATGKWLYYRLLITMIFGAGIYFIQGVQTFWTLIVALAGLLAICILEEINSPFGNNMEEGVEIE